MAKSKIFNPGLLKHKVTLHLVKEGVINDRGFYIDGGTVKKVVKAQITKYSFTDVAYKASDLTAESPTINVVIRYIDELTNKDKIEIKGKVYNIKSLNNINFESKFLEIGVDL